MPKDHFWNKRSSKKESTLDGTKANGLTRNGDLTRDGGSPRSSQKVGKGNSSGTGIKHLFGWGPIRKKSNSDDGKVPRSVSSSALSETRTLGFQRTVSNGEPEPWPNRTNDYLAPMDRRLERQRHSSDRALQTNNSPQLFAQIYSLPADTIKRVDSDRNSPSPVGSRTVKPPQQDYTEPWSTTASDGTSTIGAKSRSSIHHAKTGSGKKKENVSPGRDTSLSPPSVSPVTVNKIKDDANNNDDYEEPWDKYTGGMPPFRKKSNRDKVGAGRISPKPPAKLPAELLKQPVLETIKPLPPLPPLLADDEGEDIVTAKNIRVLTTLPKRSVSLKMPSSSVSDYSEPLDSMKRATDVKRMSDTVLKVMDQCSSHGGSSSEELQSPSPPPLPIRHATTPIVNTSIPLDQQP